MRKIILLFAIIFATINAQSELVIKCKIRTYDNKIPINSVVSYEDNNGIVNNIFAQNDGTATIKVVPDIFVKLTFSAVEHVSSSFYIPTPSNLDTLGLMVILRPNQLYPSLDSVKIIGNFNDYNFETGYTMEKKSDSLYSYKLKINTDTLKYQVLPIYNNIPVLRSFNGQLADFYEYDNGGDFRSCIIGKGKEVEIEFNTKNFQQGYFPEKISFSNEDYLKQFDKYKKSQDFYMQYFLQRSNMIIAKNVPEDELDKKMLELKIQFLDSIKNTISDVSEPNIRLLSILEYLKIATDGINMRGLSGKVDLGLIKEITRVNPESSIWAKEGNSWKLAFLDLLLGDDENPEYTNKVLNSNQPDEVKTVALEILIRYFSENNLDSLQNKYYNILVTQYPESEEANRVKALYSKDKSIQVGKTIPNFELKNLDNESEVINPQILKGKYVLVDVWGTWCAPCLMELPYLVSAYNKFKDKNFTIYSVAIETDAETVRKFRKKSKKILWLSDEEQPQTTMPWLHSYAGNWDSQIVKTFEVFGVPSTFLIDPEGKIIATSNLRGEELLHTLEKLIK